MRECPLLLSYISILYKCFKILIRNIVLELDVLKIIRIIRISIVLNIF